MADTFSRRDLAKPFLTFMLLLWRPYNGREDYQKPNHWDSATLESPFFSGVLKVLLSRSPKDQC